MTTASKLVGPTSLDVMTNLIPTPRADKNGRVVVRHMKPESSGQRDHSIPAPNVVAPDADNALMEGAYNAILNVVLEGAASQSERTFIEDRLRELPSETLVVISELPDSENYTRLWGIHTAMKDMAPSAFITDLVYLADMLEQRGIDEIFFSDYVRGFRYYEDLCPLGSSGSYPELRASQCRVLTDVCMTMVDMIDEELISNEDMTYPTDTDSDEWTPFVRDADLRHLLLASEYDTDKVVSLIQERKIIDPDDLKAILDQDINALAKGAL